MNGEKLLAIKAFVNARRVKLAQELADTLTFDGVETLKGVSIDDLLIIEGAGYRLNLETGHIEPVGEERYGLK